MSKSKILFFSNLHISPPSSSSIDAKVPNPLHYHRRTNPSTSSSGRSQVHRPLHPSVPKPQILFFSIVEPTASMLSSELFIFSNLIWSSQQLQYSISSRLYCVLIFFKSSCLLFQSSSSPLDDVFKCCLLPYPCMVEVRCLLHWPRPLHSIVVALRRFLRIILKSSNFSPSSLGSMVSSSSLFTFIALIHINVVSSPWISTG